MLGDARQSRGWPRGIAAVGRAGAGLHDQAAAVPFAPRVRPICAFVASARATAQSDRDGGCDRRTFCKSDPAPGQCDKPPVRKCPPCTGVDSPALDKDAVFFSWNRAHFGAWVITSSPLILGMCKLVTLYIRG